MVAVREQRPLDDAVPAGVPGLLARVLRERFAVPEDKIAAAVAVAEEKGQRLSDVIIQQKVLDENALARALAEAYRLPLVEELPRRIDHELVTGSSKLPVTLARAHAFVPFQRVGRRVRVACFDPSAMEYIDDLRVLLGGGIDIVVAPFSQVINAINQVYSDAKSITEGLGDEELDELEDQEALEEIGDLVDQAGDEPIIRFVNNILFRAVKDGASDIHIEPMERDVVIRFRIDGVLHETVRIPKAAQPRVTSRVKIMGNLNIAEKRLPQDGRIRIKIGGKDIDIRLSVLPVTHGERLVMRLLDRSAVRLDLAQLGFLSRDLEHFNDLIERPHGIFLVTGPTGSGKTTTLYSALAAINTVDRNILTAEDPVEYQLMGIGQMPVNAKINLGFAEGLRTMLRQDPDVIMVGEIRDKETADIAVQASLTGHLVFSTVHTNDASSTVTRLVDMGVEPFLVGSSLIGILAQRLVRMLCGSCKVQYEATVRELLELGLRPEALTERPKFHKTGGCDKCNNWGYKGRRGIYELMVIEDELRQLIMENANALTIKRAAIARGMRTLREDGAAKVSLGWTTVEEVLRATKDAVIDMDLVTAAGG